MPTNDLERELLAILDAEVDEAILGLGFQLCVIHRGSTLVDLAASDEDRGEPMRRDTVHNIVCGTKPIGATLVSFLAAGGSVPIDEPLADLLPEWGIDSRITPRGLLAHAYGLGGPSMADVHSITADRCHEIAIASLRAPTMTPTYSEVTAWYALSAAIERVTGHRAAELAAQVVATPLGRPGELEMVPAAAPAGFLDRIGPYYLGLPVAPVALAHDRSSFLLRRDAFVTGGYVTARGLAAFYAAVDRLLTAVGWAPRSVLIDLLAHPARPRRGPSQVLGPFAGGFMVDLPAHGWPAWLSRAALGHTGWAGASAGFGDPERGLSVGFISNGLEARADDRSRLWRRLLAPLRELT